MIKFACTNCNHKIGAPEKCAGKRVRCPKCKAPTRVPESTGKTGAHQPHLIKFRCPKCSQKIAVSADHAGKRVRCGKCKTPLRIPEAPGRPGRPAVKAETAALRAGESKSSAYTNESPELGSIAQGPISPEQPKKKHSTIVIGAVCVLGFLLVVAVAWYSLAGSGTSKTESEIDTEVDQVQEVAEEDVYLAEADKIDQATEPAGDPGLLFLIKQNGKSGYINKRGQIVIEPQFNWAYDFTEGLAYVGIQGKEKGKPEKHGFIDNTGKIEIVLPREWSWPRVFSEGFSVVATTGGQNGYINKTGKLVIEPSFEFAYEFSEGLARVKTEVGGKYHYIDKSGKDAFRQKFDNARDFSEGLAAVASRGKWGYINNTGRYVIEPQFFKANSFSQGLALVRSRKKYRGYIDRTGKTVIELDESATAAKDFSQGLAVVRIGGDKRGRGGKWGYIDKTGRMVIKPRFDWVSGFSEGLARIRTGMDKQGKGGKYGYIDKTGKVVIKPQFDFANEFSYGLAKVSLGERTDRDILKDPKLGYIDKRGRYVWEPTN